MDMNKLLILSFLFVGHILMAQSLEMGTTIGGMAYSGDLNPSSDFWQVSKIHPAIGVQFRVNINDFLAVRLNGMHGTISGDDARAKDEGRRVRNLHFKSQLQEIGLIGELHLLRLNPMRSKNTFAPYIFGGIGLFHFNPKALYKGDWVALQPLGTEGQWQAEGGYSLWEIAIPLGGGLKYAINESWIIGLELGGRLTMTDYLDDVSRSYADAGVLLEEMGQAAADLSDRRAEINSSFVATPGTSRGSTEHNDYYFTGGLSISYRLVGSKTQRKQMKQGRNKCPWQ